MLDALAKIPTPVIVGAIILVVVFAIISIIKKAIKIGIFLVGLAVIITLGLPMVEKAKDDPTINQLKEGIEHVTDMSDMFNEKYFVE